MSSKAYRARPSYRFLTPAPTHPDSPTPPPFEFDESDLYANSWTHQQSPTNSSTQARSAQRQAPRRSEVAHSPSSLPVNVPDWSKILMAEYRPGRKGGDYHGIDDDGDEDDERSDREGGTGRRVTVPPHEFLARQTAKSTTTRVACSVHEGVGRTLKGRDLSRVRNAIWEKTGFQD